MPLGDPPNPFTTPIAFTSQSDVTLQTILAELRAIRELLEMAERRAEAQDQWTRNLHGSHSHEDLGVAGQRAMMAGEK